MKHRIMIAAMLLVSLTAVQGQIDSIPYNVHFPYYYVGNSFDSIHACTHDGIQCVPGNRILCETTPYWHGIAVPDSNIRYVAYGFYPDTTIHIIGMAWTTFWSVASNQINNAYNAAQYWFPQYYNEKALCRIYHPDGNLLTVLDSATFEINDFNPDTYRVFQFTIDYTGNIIPWNPYNPNNIYNYQYYMYEVYFDNEIDVSDSIYVSIKRDIIQSYCSDEINGFVECHTQPTNNYVYPNLNYRFIRSNETEDIPSTFGTIHAYPFIFPIIRRDCDTCPTVRGIEVVPSGSNSVFLRWQRGNNHLGWHLAYGPTGTAPENCTTLDFTSPISTILNLSPDTQYVAYLRARCRFARDEWGPWSDPVTLNTTEGIDEAQLAGMITLSPNPATQTVTVESPLPMTLLEAYDEKGALMTSTATPTLDVSRWPTGVYLLRIYTPQGMATKKLTVSR